MLGRPRLCILNTFRAVDLLKVVTSPGLLLPSTRFNTQLLARCSEKLLVEARRHSLLGLWVVGGALDALGALGRDGKALSLILHRFLINLLTIIDGPAVNQYTPF